MRTSLSLTKERTAGGGAGGGVVRGTKNGNMLRKQGRLKNKKVRMKLTYIIEHNNKKNDSMTDFSFVFYQGH